LSVSHVDVIIIGGGVIGCSIAYNLAKSQVNSLIIEKAAGVGREASWSGAGILASNAPTREPYAELSRASLALYPSLAEELKAQTQIDIEFCDCRIRALQKWHPPLTDYRQINL
jgi:glycine oxidase